MNNKLCVSIKDDNQRIFFFFLNSFKKGLYNNFYVKRV